MVIKAMMSHQAGLAPWIPFHAKSMIQGELDPSIYSRDSSAKFPYRVAQGIYIRTDYDTTILRQITDKELQAKEYKYSDLGYFFIKKMVEKIRSGFSKFFHELVSSEREIRSKRFISIGGFVVLTICYMSNLFFGLDVDPKLQESMEFIVIAGLGTVVAEKFAKK
jgi:hypothetical protein